MKKGDLVRGRVVRQSPKGLWVDVGVSAFLPAADVDVEPVEDLRRFIGREIECLVLKADDANNHYIVSRRRALELRAKEKQLAALDEIFEGDVCKGRVTSLQDFGAFVDLGAIEGLIHVSDLAWRRVGHPSEVLQPGDRVRVKVLRIERDRRRVSLGLKQLTEDPWSHVGEKYPAGGRFPGTVARLVRGGAVVQLEPGVEGLVHVSELSWTREVRDPGEVLEEGAAVEVFVMSVEPDKRRLQLSLKRVKEDPWTIAQRTCLPGTRLRGRIRKVVSYGAFVEVAEDLDGLLHVSDLSWTQRTPNAKERLQAGDEVEVVVLDLDVERKRIALGRKQCVENPWLRAIPERYPAGTRVPGLVTRIVNFGAFVELEPELEGLLHTSAMGLAEGRLPRDVLAEGDRVEVEVMSLDPGQGNIRLKLVRVVESKRAEAAGAEEARDASGTDGLTPSAGSGPSA